MKRKIHFRLVLIAVLSILSTTILLSVVYYRLLSKQVVADLKTYVTFLVQYNVEIDELDAEALAKKDGLRITLIDSQGQVLFDNGADSVVMENHSDRPEVEKALMNGEGQAIRKSETIGRSTCYYAVRLQDGCVLRVAMEAASSYSIFVSSLPSLIILLCILIGICIVLARILTNSLIAPIENLTAHLEEGTELTKYQELAPFAEMIQKQHQDIIKNARVRQDFTANVTHELKTPLTSISGYAELIESGMASEDDVTRFATGIRKSANRLLTLINDTIRLSELDSEEQEVTMERLNLFALAETCVEMLSMNAERHHVAIQCKGRDSFVTANRQMMEELLYNLSDNAIRYNNENGTVTVEVYSRQSQTVLVVSDTGIGIPKDHQERIFERFYRVDKSRSKSTGGTGLGLAIVKHIIQKHNAKINLESEAGKGTRITVIFDA